MTVAIAEQPQGSSQGSSAKWWKGNLHTHSLWSDGNDFPEMIVKWYADRDYHFLSLTDHNILSAGKKWMPVDAIVKRGGKTVIEKYTAAYPEGTTGAMAIVRRDVKGKQQIRLKALEEFRANFEQPQKFLLIQGEEISDRSESVPVHMNAINLAALIQPVGGKTVRETINNNLRAAEEQAASNGESILVQVNHPNFGWAVTAEELAAAKTGCFMEVYNAHPAVNHLGNKDRPGVERIWDIANTIRISELGDAPIYGTATDDSHHYHGVKDSQPGRAWVMVRSDSLEPGALLKAMKEGDFYASSGVTLSDLNYDLDTKLLSLKIQPQEGVTFNTDFIGTPKDYEKSTKPRMGSDGKPGRVTRVYSNDVGKVLKTEAGLTPTFQLTGDELYVRAVVTSSVDHPNPTLKEQKEQAWTQPVGWK